MNQAFAAVTDWPAAAVAIGILVLIVVLTGWALYKEGTDAALKMYAALGTLVGLLTGSASTYFFTRESMEAAQEQTTTANELAKSASNQAESLRTELDDERVITVGLQGEVQSRQLELKRLADKDGNLGIKKELTEFPTKYVRPDRTLIRPRPPIDRGTGGGG